MEKVWHIADAGLAIEDEDLRVECNPAEFQIESDKCTTGEGSCDHTSLMSIEIQKRNERKIRNQVFNLGIRASASHEPFPHPITILRNLCLPMDVCVIYPHSCNSPSQILQLGFPIYLILYI
jgi:hypothetical protein